MISLRCRGDRLDGKEIPGTEVNSLVKLVELLVLGVFIGVFFFNLVDDLEFFNLFFSTDSEVVREDRFSLDISLNVDIYYYD